MRHAHVRDGRAVQRDEPRQRVAHVGVQLTVRAAVVGDGKHARKLHEPQLLRRHGRGAAGGCATIGADTTVTIEFVPAGGGAPEALRAPLKLAKGEVVEATEGDVEGDNDDLQEEAA